MAIPLMYIKHQMLSLEFQQTKEVKWFYFWKKI